MGVRECGQKKDSYKRELKEMRAMVKEAHRAGKAAKVPPTHQPLRCYVCVCVCVVCVCTCICTCSAAPSTTARPLPPLSGLGPD